MWSLKSIMPTLIGQVTILNYGVNEAKQVNGAGYSTILILDLTYPMEGNHGIIPLILP